MSGSIWDRLAPRRAAVDAALERALADHAAGAPRELVDAIGYSLLAPGKRLRPLLAVLACEAVGGAVEQAMPAACAVEMVHTYSLVHDDLPAMDDDDLRRGRPTSHKVYGEALAILVGDALLTLAFEVLAAGCPPAVAAVSCAELARGAGAAGMVAGQVLDLAAEGRIAGPKAATAADLEAIHRRKTGALIRSAVRLGVHAAECRIPATLAAADRYAAALGLAFQVTDDLLDVEGSADRAGKRVGKDAARGKLTYPGLLGVTASREMARALGREAVAAAGALGPGGDTLAALARDVVDRDR